MMRILVGIRLRNSDTERFDIVVTKITARHITNVVAILMVTAKAEQMPSTCSASWWSCVSSIRLPLSG